MMQLFRPPIFEQFPKVTAGLSLRDPKSRLHDQVKPWDYPRAIQNRTLIAENLGFKYGQFIIAEQTHGAAIERIDEYVGVRSKTEVDGLITDKPDLLIGVTAADCVTILAYDPKTGAIAATHSGWKGTLAGAIPAMFAALKKEYKVNPADCFIYQGPGACAKCYEFGKELAAPFAAKYKAPHLDPTKVYIDNPLAVYDQVLAAGVPKQQIERDLRCSMEDVSLHSFRRDKAGFGLMVAAIGKRD